MPSVPKDLRLARLRAEEDQLWSEFQEQLPDLIRIVDRGPSSQEDGDLIREVFILAVSKLMTDDTYRIRMEQTSDETPT